MIKNKDKRAKVYAKQKHEKKIEKQKKIKARDAAEKLALELGEEPPQKMVPKIIENTREADDTVCRPDDQELFADIDADEFNPVLRREVTPKVLITTCRFNSTRGPAFISELLSVIPNFHYHKRGTYDLKKIVEYAKKKDYTSLIVVHTNRREPDALLIIGLPNGPIAHFKLSNLVLGKDIKLFIISLQNHGNPTSHEPELVLNNFTTRLGNHFFQSLFPQEPNFRGRRVVTFHNQRDFILFRHHRYIFQTKESKQSGTKGKDGVAQERVKPRLQVRNHISFMCVWIYQFIYVGIYVQECGPRFTLKLVTLQHGTFDTKGGEFEWVHKPERDTSRRRFFL
ncbi:hypothetical protein Bca52824_002370 [Brassica carinata]|uniref:Brix domain-containing protein n=1 Tax=Brassica carinata TaxID=52824 RepID=A0A8X7WL11_BRACI|nr:hypothetical protein Bca52824_002370 [Brassica carinata]